MKMLKLSKRYDMMQRQKDGLDPVPHKILRSNIDEDSQNKIKKSKIEKY